MAKGLSPRLAAMLARQPAMAEALALANRDARLFHARLGHSVCDWRDGKIVWVSPAEIFASYGLDECGRPKPGPEPEYYL